MATRSHAREAIAGLLYAYSVGNTDISLLAKDYLQTRKIKNKQQEFALSLLEGTISHLNELDSMLNQQLKEWEFSRLGQMEKSILRLGAFEILYTKTDHAIIINEAIELAKIYIGDKSPQFINGILDSLAKKTKTT